MAKQKRKLAIACDGVDCGNGLHCFRPPKKTVEHNTSGVCRSCGAGPVDWARVHARSLDDLLYTVAALKNEFIRHEFWNIELGQRAINHAKRKGKEGLLVSVRRHLTTVIGPANPFRDGAQTPMPIPEDATTIYSYAQHATATCCRKCVEYWHGIPQGKPLSDSELDYLSLLVGRYIEDRIPNLTIQGENISPCRL